MGISTFLFVEPGWGFVVFVVGICLFFYFLGDCKLEYEYAMTNGSVEIAAVYNASRRKELMHFELEQVTMIVPKGSERIAHETFRKKRDFTSKKKKEKEIALVLELESGKELIFMEPNKKSLEHIKMYTKNKYYDI